ncbi:hypothetical protein ACHAWU_005544 [Discostella pseudostelligera]|uniref:XPG-I domain-containing protein n=1 Tax=Discostella pseudostelligera TaxID=259834 RepID=A0ABD3N8U1_9STRA
MGINGLLPRILPSAGRENYDLRALSDGLITINNSSAVSSSSSSSSWRRRGAGAGVAVGDGETDENNADDNGDQLDNDGDDGKPAAKKRRKSSTTNPNPTANQRSTRTWSRRKVRIAVDINGWIARASHGYGGFLMDERHLSYHGRNELKNERRLAREKEKEQLHQLQRENAADDGRGDGDGVGRATNVGSHYNTNADDDGDDDPNENEQFQTQQQRLEYITKCTSFVLQRLEFLRNDCSALVLPVLDGMTPPVKRNMVRARSDRRIQAMEVRDELVESQSPMRPTTAASVAAASTSAARVNANRNAAMEHDDEVEGDAEEITEAARTEAEVLRRISASKRAGTGKDYSLRREILSSLLTEFRKRSWPVLVAPYEADGQLGYLANCHAVDLVVTEDSDLIALGVPRLVYRLGGWNGKNDANRSSSSWQSGGNALLRGTLLERSDLGSSQGLDLRDFSNAMLATMFVAAGCDYCDSLKGIGIVTSRNIVKKAFHGGEADGKYRRESNLPVLRILLNELFRSCSKDVRAQLLPLDDPEKEGLRLAYERSFLAALAMYRHPLVYDPILGEHVIANDVSVDANGNSRAATASSLFLMDERILMEYEPYKELVTVKENLYQVVGTPMHPRIARGIAEGLIDPRQLPTQEPGDEAIDTSETELPNAETTTAMGEDNASSLQVVDEGDLMTQGSSGGGVRFELATQETIGAGTQQSSSGTSERFLNFMELFYSTGLYRLHLTVTFNED